MMGEVVDEDYITSGKNRQAMFASVMSLVNVPAQAVLVWLFPFILDLCAYDGLTASQTLDAIYGIRFGVTFLRVIVIILAMVALDFYPLKGKRYIELRKKVELIE